MISRSLNFRRRENAVSHIEYAVVKATIAHKTDSAVLLSVKEDEPAKWVPIFRLEVYSRALVYRSTKGDEVTLQVQLAFALDRGLV